MRCNHSYISLTVNEKLPDEVAKKWLKIVRSLSPSGTLSSAAVTVGGKTKSSELYVIKEEGSPCYVIPLSRNLLEDEAGKIAIAWSRSWDGDFEVNFSQPESSKQRKKDEIRKVLDQLAENIAKLSHARWAKNKVNHHWSYSTRYNAGQKQHPMLLPWEQLPSKHQRSEIDRIREVLEILDSMNLKISRK